MQARDSQLGTYYADLPTHELHRGETIRFCIEWQKAQKTERSAWYKAHCDEVEVETEEQPLMADGGEI